MAIYDGNNLTGNEKFESNDIINYEYTGAIKSVTLNRGVFFLEIYGAQGGDWGDSYTGGKGGYSYGYLYLNSPTTLYIVVGGRSYQSRIGGYNGGGNATNWNYHQCKGSGGGGATHIALVSGLLNTLENEKDKIIMVAGGGGGVRILYKGSGCYGGYGGGLTGGRGDMSGGGLSNRASGYGGTQTSGGELGGTFGKGGDSTYPDNFICGGGGGYYGGGAGYQNSSPGGGGSGYVSSVYLRDCATLGNYRNGNGFARITVIDTLSLFGLAKDFPSNLIYTYKNTYWDSL